MAKIAEGRGLQNSDSDALMEAVCGRPCSAMLGSDGILVRS